MNRGFEGVKFRFLCITCSVERGIDKVSSLEAKQWKLCLALGSPAAGGEGRQLSTVSPFRGTRE